MPERLQPLLSIGHKKLVRGRLMEHRSAFDAFEPRGTGSGEEALEMLQRLPSVLCVVDLRLPGMDARSSSRPPQRPGSATLSSYTPAPLISPCPKPCQTGPGQGERIP